MLNPTLENACFALKTHGMRCINRAARKDSPSCKCFLPIPLYIKVLPKTFNEWSNPLKNCACHNRLFIYLYVEFGWHGDVRLLVQCAKTSALFPADSQGWQTGCCRDWDDKMSCSLSELAVEWFLYCCPRGKFLEEECLLNAAPLGQPLEWGCCWFWTSPERAKETFLS